MADQYLTHDDYNVMGGILSKPEFENQEFAARKEIDKETHKRIVIENDEANVSDDVLETLKRLVFALISQELLGSVMGRKTTSESNGRRSASYTDDKGEAERLIRTYLAGEVNKDGVQLISPSIQVARVLRT